jgi:hypothetical protein
VQRTYRRQFAVAAAGTLWGTGVPLVRTVENTADSRYELWTLAVPATPTANAVYSVTVDGVTVSFNAGGTPTQASLEAGLMSAIRQSTIYDTSKVVLDAIAHTITIERRIFGLAMVVTVAGAGLTATRTVAASLAGQVPFGRFVTRPASAVGLEGSQARLPVSGDTAIVGVTMATHFSEKVGVGVNAISGYQPNEAMDAVFKTVTLEGIWVEFTGNTSLPESSYIDTVVQASVLAGHQGKATNVVAAGNINVTGAVFRSKPEVDPNGNPIILVALL